MKKIEHLLQQAKQGERIEIDQHIKSRLKQKMLASKDMQEPRIKGSSYFLKRLSIILVPALISFVLFFQFYTQETKLPSSIDITSLKSGEQQRFLEHTELSPADNSSPSKEKQGVVGGTTLKTPASMTGNNTEKTVQDIEPSQETVLKKGVSEEQNRDKTEGTNINQATPSLATTFTGNVQENSNSDEGCTSKHTSNTGDVSYSIIGDCYWENNTPLTFLEELKTHPQQALSILGEAPQGWITKEHIRQFMKLIDSQEPVAPVVSAISSYSCNQASTLGNEALFLIQGFRQGKYPPELCSVYNFKPDKEEIKKWWEENK